MHRLVMLLVLVCTILSCESEDVKKAVYDATGNWEIVNTWIESDCDCVFSDTFPSPETPNFVKSIQENIIKLYNDLPINIIQAKNEFIIKIPKYNEIHDGRVKDNKYTFKGIGEYRKFQGYSHDMSYSFTNIGYVDPETDTITGSVKYHLLFEKYKMVCSFTMNYNAIRIEDVNKHQK